MKNIIKLRGLILLASLMPITLHYSFAQSKILQDFIPEDYILYDIVHGDLNQDSIADIVLIIKGTEPEKWQKNHMNELVDRNRRGLVVLLKDYDGYEQVALNKELFASENEDGGVYYAPELDVNIDQGILNLHFSHGRYGWWNYKFRYENMDFELIGYDQSDNAGPVIREITSINFLTKQKKTQVNTNDDTNFEQEEFEESWTNLDIEKPIRLSEIDQIDELDFNEF